MTRLWSRRVKSPSGHDFHSHSFPGFNGLSPEPLRQPLEGFSTPIAESTTSKTVSGGITLFYCVVCVANTLKTGGIVCFMEANCSCCQKRQQGGPGGLRQSFVDTILRVPPMRIVTLKFDVNKHLSKIARTTQYIYTLAEGALLL